MLTPGDVMYVKKTFVHIKTPGKKEDNFKGKLKWFVILQKTKENGKNIYLIISVLVSF